MQLIHFGVQVDFKKGIPLSTSAARFLDTLPGGSVERRSKEPSIVWHNQETRSAVNWGRERGELIFEKVENRDDCIVSAMQDLQAMTFGAPVPTTGGCRVVTYWILPAPNHTLASLEGLYKRKMKAEMSFIKGPCPSSVVVDLAVDKCILHHQSCPMGPGQLFKSFQSFEREDIPQTFLFLYASFLDPRMIQVTDGRMQAYLERAFDQCRRHSNVFGRMWKGCL
jgi:hypothetical protein